VAKNKLWNHKIFSLIANILAKHKNNKFVYQFILFAQKLNENFELKLYKKCLRPGMNVIDIGANFGLYSIEASKLISPNGRVFSFEPEPSTYKALENKIKQLGINNVSLSSKALSNKKGHQKLYFDELNVGGHSFSEKNPYRSRSYHKVETTTLDDVFHNIKIDLIKIDTQGAEGLVITGGLELLKKNKPTIFLAFWPNGTSGFEVTSSDLLDIFANLGYKITVIDKTKKRTYKVDREMLYALCANEKHSNDNVDVILEID